MEDITTLDRLLDPSVIATCLAAIAAIVSGLVAWRQHVWNKQHNSEAMDWNKRNHLASVRPFLTDFMEEEHDPLSFEYTVTNKGLGPAIVDEFKVTWNGEPTTMNKIQGDLEHQLGIYFRIRVGEFNEHFALAVGEEFLVLRIQISSDRIPISANPPKELELAVDTLLMNCRLHIRYRSFLSDEVQTFSTTLTENIAKGRGLIVSQSP